MEGGMKKGLEARVEEEFGGRAWLGCKWRPGKGNPQYWGWILTLNMDLIEQEEMREKGDLVERLVLNHSV